MVAPRCGEERRAAGGVARPDARAFREEQGAAVHGAHSRLTPATVQWKTVQIEFAGMQMAKDPLDRADIDLFLALVEGGRLDAAARAIGVHHATAFRRLEDLEAKVGARLFERVGGDYRATLAGRSLVEAARRLREQLLEFDARVLHHDAALSGEVRLTSSDGRATWRGYARSWTDCTRPRCKIGIGWPGRAADVHNRPLRSTRGVACVSS